MSKRPVNPADLAAPVGFAHAWLVEHGEQRTLYLAGQCGYDVAGKIESRGDLVAQLDKALANIGCVLRDAQMTFADVVQLNFYVTSRDDYAAARKSFGAVWRRHCGKHYPGMAMFQVSSLFDPEARIEVQGIARTMTESRFDPTVAIGLLMLAGCAADAPEDTSFDDSAGSAVVDVAGDGFVRFEGRRLPLEAVVLELRQRTRAMPRDDMARFVVRLRADHQQPGSEAELRARQAKSRLVDELYIMGVQQVLYQ